MIISHFNFFLIHCFRETVEDLLSLAQETASTAVRACLLNDSPTASSPYLMQLKSVSALKGSLLATEDEETQVTLAYCKWCYHTGCCDMPAKDIGI